MIGIPWERVKDLSSSPRAIYIEIHSGARFNNVTLAKDRGFAHDPEGRLAIGGKARVQVAVARDTHAILTRSPDPNRRSQQDSPLP